MEHALQLEIAHASLDGLGVALYVCSGGGVVLALCEIEQLSGVGDGLGCAVELGQLGGELGALAPQLLRLVGFLPDRRVFQLPIDFL
jgi:hypothetical protein